MCLVTLLVLVAVGATVAGQMSGSLIFRKAVPQKLCCKSKRLKAWRQCISRKSWPFFYFHDRSNIL